ncbi:tetratricopeptide repeat protein [Oleiharenicola lentus]|uniref:tetratricopeptide repeat protein n=1 Tax=Oleiharenicola lentus TaxID=2508720 RepID=UPI003F66AE25
MNSAAPSESPKDNAPLTAPIVRVPRRRWGRWILIALCGLYVSGAVGGWLVLRYAGKQREVRFLDVALLRWQEVRRSVAAQQFTRARAEVEAKDFRAAHMLFNSALRRDPGNLTGRLAAADFFQKLGATDLEIEVLEAGLALSPDEPKLVQRLFALLTSTGRDQHALNLLRQNYGAGFAGRAQADWLQVYEIVATRNVRGPAEALQLLQKNPRLRDATTTAAVIAPILWDGGEAAAAIDLLGKFISAESALPAAYATLASWQEAAGRVDDAVRTAEAASQRFPHEVGSQVLLVETLSLRPAYASRWSQQVGFFLHTFRGDPAALHLLARAAGRRGWLELAWTLYEIGATHDAGASQLALYYADALAFRARFADTWQVLADIEKQSAAAPLAFVVQLRQRQVMTAAALDNQENVREYARRLAEQVRGDAGSFELCRRLFTKLNIALAAAEFSPEAERRSPAAKNLADLPAPSPVDTPVAENGGS